jgi:hypothetical protein
MKTFNGSELIDFRRTKVGMGSLGINSRPSAGGISVVQSKSITTDDGSADLRASFDTPVTAGNSILALISWDDPSIDGLSQGPITVGGIGQDLDFVANVGDVPLPAAIYSLMNSLGGHTGITYTTPNPVRANLTILEVSGLANAAAEDTSSAFGSGPDMAPEPISPIGVPCLAVYVEAYSSPFNVFDSGPSQGFTRIGTGIGGAYIFQESGFLIAEVDDTLNPVTSLTGIYDWAAVSAVFRGE